MYFEKNMTKDEVDELFERIDFDQNGFIDYEEFQVAALGQEDLFTTERLKQAFKMFDKDGNGSISIDEVIEVLSFNDHFDEALAKEIVAQVDLDGNGEIDFKEFTQMMVNICDHCKH